MSQFLVAAKLEQYVRQRLGDKLWPRIIREATMHQSVQRFHFTNATTEVPYLSSDDILKDTCISLCFPRCQRFFISRMFFVA